jgi:hypothetical protein
VKEFIQHLKSFSRLLLIFCLLVVGFFYSQQSAYALTVSPAIIELSVDPGQTITKEITLFNETGIPAQLFATTQDFEAAGDGGQPKFLPKAVPSNEASASNWVSVSPSQIVVEPGKFVKTQFTVTVPANADPGGHYLAVFWGIQPPVVSGPAAVAIGAKIGSLVLIGVTGDISEKGELKEFALPEGKIYTHLPVEMAFRFFNSGNIHLKPKGDIVVRNLLGGKVATISANDKEARVLPNQTRQFFATWQKQDPDLTAESLGWWQKFWAEFQQERSNFAFGRYTAQLNLAFGQDKSVHTARLAFWVIPWALLIVYLILLIILLIIIGRLFRMYNRWVIHNYHKGNNN